MVKAYDVDQSVLVRQIAEDLKEDKKLTMPDWARFVKTGSNKERPPIQSDWWYFRAASILRKVYTLGPIGVSKLRTKFGSKKNRGMKPEAFVKSGGKVIRCVFQQLESAGYIKKSDKPQLKGRVITPKGASLMDKAAGKISKADSKSDNPTKAEVPAEAAEE